MDSSSDRTPETEAAVKWAVEKAREAAAERERKQQARRDSLVNPHRR